MAPTTPSGSRTISELPTFSSQATFSSCSGIEPKSMVGRPACTIFDSASGMPSSVAISAASSSPRSASLAAMPAQVSERASIGVCDQTSNAARAA